LNLTLFNDAFAPEKLAKRGLLWWKRIGKILEERSSGLF